jgi:hypothetical protein
MPNTDLEDVLKTLPDADNDLEDVLKTLPDAVDNKNEKSLLDLITKNEKGVFDKTYLAGFEKRAREADTYKEQLDKERTKGQTDEADNKLIDTVANISKKYGLKQSELLAYARADGWIPKHQQGLSQVVTGTLSDIVGNADTFLEREHQDYNFTPEAVQALVETRRAVQESMGVGRMGLQLAGEVGAAFAQTAATGPLAGVTASANALKIAPKITKLVGKVGNAAAIQGGLSGAAQGVAFRDTDVAKPDEPSDTPRPEGTWEDFKNFVGEKYNEYVSSTPAYVEAKKNYPKSVAAVEGFVPGAILGQGVHLGLSKVAPAIYAITTQTVKKQLAKQLKTKTANVNRLVDQVLDENVTHVSQLSNKSKQLVAKEFPGQDVNNLEMPEVKEKLFSRYKGDAAIFEDIQNTLDHDDLSEPTKTFLKNSFGDSKTGFNEVKQNIGVISGPHEDVVNTAFSNTPIKNVTDNGLLEADGVEAIFNTAKAGTDSNMRPLLDIQSQGMNNGRTVAGQGVRKELLDFASKARVAKNIVEAEKLERLANAPSANLNDVNWVIKQLGGDENLDKLEPNRSATLRAIQNQVQDRNYDDWYVRQLLENIKSNFLTPQTKQDVLKWYQNNFEKSPSKLVTDMAKAMEKSKAENNPVMVAETLNDPTKLKPDSVLGAIDEMQQNIFTNQVDQAYLKKDLRAVDRDIAEKLKQYKTLTDDHNTYERLYEETSVKYENHKLSLKKQIEDFDVPSGSQILQNAKDDILEAIDGDLYIPQGSIDTIAKYISENNDVTTANSMNTLANNATVYNKRFADLQKSYKKIEGSIDAVVAQEKVLDKYPELRSDEYTDVQIIVAKFTQNLIDAGDNIAEVFSKLKEQSDFLLFGSKYADDNFQKLMYSNEKFANTMRKLPEFLKFSDKDIPKDFIDEMRALSFELKNNKQTQIEATQVVRGLDKLNRLSENLDNIADSLEVINYDNKKLANTIGNLEAMRIDQNALVATRINYINEQQKRLGYNRKTHLELERLKKRLEPALDARFEESYTTKQKGVIERFLRSDMFERLRIMKNNPDFVMYMDEHIDNMFDTRSILQPMVREEIANAYFEATGKLLPENTLYAHVLTPVNMYQGSDARLVEIFKIAAETKRKNPNELLKRQTANSAVVDTMVSNNTHLAAFAAHSSVLTDMKYTRKIADQMAEQFFTTVRKLQAFDGSNYKSHMMREEFVNLRHRLLGVEGSDLKSYPIFNFDKETNTISGSKMYELFADIFENQKQNKYISFAKNDILTLAEKHFENAPDAVAYVERYFGTDSKYLKPASMELALKSSFEAKVYDYKSIEAINKEIEKFNKLRGTKFPPIDYRSDFVKQTLLEKEFTNLDDNRLLKSDSDRLLSGSVDSQVEKAGNYDIKNLVHPDKNVYVQTRMLATKALMRDSTQKLRQVGLLAERMGYVDDAISINNALRGNLTFNDAIGATKFFEVATQSAKYRPTFSLYLLMRQLKDSLVTSGLSQTTNAVKNLVSNDFTNIAFGKKNWRTQKTILSEAPKNLGKIVGGLATDSAKGLAKFATDLPGHLLSYPWKVFAHQAGDAIEMARSVGDNELVELLEKGNNKQFLVLPNLGLEANKIVNKTLNELVEQENAITLRTVVAQHVQAEGQDLGDGLAQTTQRGVNSLSEALGRHAERLTGNFKERVETTILQSQLKMAATVYERIVDEVYTFSRQNPNSTTIERANFAIESLKKHSIVAGEHKTDLRLFANTIVNEIEKPNGEKYKGLRDFLLYSNDMMQVRYGSASNPIAVNNFAKAVPLVNQFFSATTGNVYKLMRLTAQTKGQLTERNFEMWHALAGAAAIEGAALVFQHGAGNLVAESYATISNLPEQPKEAILSKKFADLLLDKQFSFATYKFLTNGAQIPLWSQFGAVGQTVSSVLAGWDTGQKSGNIFKGVAQAANNSPRMGGVGASIAVEVADVTYGLGQLVVEGLQLSEGDWSGEDYQKILLARRNKERDLLARVSSLLLQVVIPSKDLAKNPILAVDLLTDPQARLELQKLMITDPVLSQMYIPEPSLLKFAKALDIKNQKIQDAISNTQKLSDMYFLSGLNRYTKDYVNFEKQNLQKPSAKLKEILNGQQSGIAKYLENTMPDTVREELDRQEVAKQSIENFKKLLNKQD